MVPFFDGVEHLQRRDDFAGAVHADLELAAGQLAHALGDEFGGAKQHFHRLGEARGHAPADGVRSGLGDGGGGQGSGASGDGGSAALDPKPDLNPRRPP